MNKTNNHVKRALDRVILKFKEHQEFNGLVKAFASEIQALEEALFPLLTGLRDHSTATAALLDQIGTLIGARPRGTLSDTEYRKRIGSQIQVNASNGELDRVLGVLVNLWGTVSPAGFVADDSNDPQGGTSCFVVRPTNYTTGSYVPPTVDSAKEMIVYIQAAKLAGVRAILRFAIVNEDAPIIRDGISLDGKYFELAVDRP